MPKAHRLRGALAMTAQSVYATRVPEKEGTRFGSLNSQKRINRAMRFFYACLPSRILNGVAVAGEPSGSLVYFCGQSSKPAICRSSRLEAGLRCNSQKEAHMPNRSRTSVHTADLSSTLNNKPHQSKAKALQDAHAMGYKRASSWSELDSTVRSRDAWRAVGYADAVLSFEHSPLLVELIEAWEHGFDCVNAPGAALSETMQIPGADEPKNPYYRNPGRAPYELGHLLQQLPSDYGIAPSAEPEQAQMASAIAKHADVSGNTILSGIEAIGRLMEIAATHDDEEVSSHTIFCLGDLLQHLAVEGQYVRSVGDSMAYAAARYATRTAAEKSKEARHA